MSEKSISKMLFSNQEKVELALIDDVLKWEKRAESTRSQALKSLNDVIQTYEAAKQSHGVALDAAEKALNQAKELGADEFIKKMQKSVDYNKGTIKIIEKAISNLRTSRIA
jgi:L-lactate utilization protein LutB